MILTNKQIDIIVTRVKEIDKITDLCGDNDDDVFENLQLELDHHIETLEKSYKKARIAEIGLRLVK